MDNYLYAIFNKKTKQLTCFTFDLDQFPEEIRSSLIYKRFSFSELGLDGDEINLYRFKWIGDAHTGRLVDTVKEEKAIVSEKELFEKYDNLLWLKYAPKEIIKELVLNMEMKTENGINMQKFFKKVLAKHADDVNFFKNSDKHIWESITQEENREKDAFK